MIWRIKNEDIKSFFSHISSSYSSSSVIFCGNLHRPSWISFRQLGTQAFFCSQLLQRVNRVPRLLLSSTLHIFQKGEVFLQFHLRIICYGNRIHGYPSLCKLRFHFSLKKYDEQLFYIRFKIININNVEAAVTLYMLYLQKLWEVCK